jgi:phosphonopyruvate decarboxylase
LDIQYFLEKTNQLGIDFYTGVPDSQLKVLCDQLMAQYGAGSRHIIAANEGACVGLAAGHYLSTRRPALVYMQNSGIGNAVNPVCSLAHEKVYAIPLLFVIVWRGEPGVKDEPQHVFQGEATLPLLECLGIEYFVIGKETTDAEVDAAFERFAGVLGEKRHAAFVIQKGAFTGGQKLEYANANAMTREQIVNTVIAGMQPTDIVVSTTGKLSRELFEAREARQEGHKRDFLTVGSMGHASMIALGIALEKPDRRVFCLDGDGAVLMHMGSLAVIGSRQPINLIHILVNNEAHETVGGMPTVSKSVDYPSAARAMGYAFARTVETGEELTDTLKLINGLKGPIFIEAKANLASRADLGRPTTTPQQNKEDFIGFVMEDEN